MKKIPDIQTNPISLQQYVEAGCDVVMRNGQVGAALHAATKGMLCNGCMLLRFGCSAHNKMTKAIRVQSRPTAPSETVRQEAARRSLSIAEVRRQRHAAIAAATQWR